MPHRLPVSCPLPVHSLSSLRRCQPLISLACRRSPPPSCSSCSPLLHHQHTTLPFRPFPLPPFVAPLRAVAVAVVARHNFFLGSTTRIHPSPRSLAPLHKSRFQEKKKGEKGRHSEGKAHHQNSFLILVFYFARTYHTFRRRRLRALDQIASHLRRRPSRTLISRSARPCSTPPRRPLPRHRHSADSTTRYNWLCLHGCEEQGRPSVSLTVGPRVKHKARPARPAAVPSCIHPVTTHVGLARVSPLH